MLHRRPPSSRKQRGITLILAILIMSSVVAIGITASTIVVTQVRINEVSTSSHQGYYAAESGLEQGLQEVQRLKADKSITQATTTLQGLSLPPSASIVRENTSFFPANEQKLLLTSSSSTSQTAPTTLKENQSVYVEIYNVDQSLNALPTNLPLLCIYGKGSGDEVLEVTWVGWATNLETSRSQRVEVSYSSFSDTGGGCSGQNGYTVQLQQFYPAFSPSVAGIAGYRVRITALRPASGNGDVTDFSVYVDEDGNTANGTQTPTNQIQLKAVSAGKGQKQALVATFPWTLPLSSLFDFVIFSERSLQKKIPLSISEEVKTYGPYEIEGDIDPDLGPLYSSPPYSWMSFPGTNRTLFCTDDLDDNNNIKCIRKGWNAVHCQPDALGALPAYCDGVAGGANQWLNPDASSMSTGSRDVSCWQIFDATNTNAIGSQCGFSKYHTSGTHKMSFLVPSAAFADCTTGPCNYYVRLRGRLSRTMYVNMIESGPTASSPPTFYYDYENRTTDSASQQLTLKDQLVQPVNNGAVTSCILPTAFIVNNKDANHFLSIRNLASTNPLQSGGFGTCTSNPTAVCDTDVDCASFPPNTTCNINLDTAPFIDAYDILTQPYSSGPEETFCPTS